MGAYIAKASFEPAFTSNFYVRLLQYLCRYRWPLSGYPAWRSAGSGNGSLRPVPCEPTKSIFLKKMDFSLQKTKQPVKWSPDISIHVYLEIS